MQEDNIHSTTIKSYYGAGVEAAAKAYLNSVCCKSTSPVKQITDTDTTLSSPTSGQPTDTKSKSKYFSPERKYTKMAITPKKKNIKHSKAVKSIRLVKQKTIVKSRMFMNSPNSIYAAVSNQYKNLLDAIDGSDLANLPSLDDILLIVYIHFGGCKIFEDSFDTIINSDECLSLDLIERALNNSVRHLCANECYLRAFHGIREFTFLWRDMVSDNDVNKAELLQGWCCKIQPKSKDQRRCRLPLIYASPCGREFNTKAKVINYMNKKMSTSSSFDVMTSITSTSCQSTSLINITNNINPLFSPFGLIEELYIDDPWKLLVSTICLNVTTRAQLDTGELC